MAIVALMAPRGRRGIAVSAYVSLGDSYTAGPLVPAPTGNPILCGRSTGSEFLGANSLGYVSFSLTRRARRCSPARPATSSALA